jgi:hypothetical protein
VPNSKVDRDEGPTAAEFDPFDVATALGGDLYGAISEKLLTSIQIKKPEPDEFIRVSPTLKLTPATMLTVDSGRETYFVHPMARVGCPPRFILPVTFYFYMTRLNAIRCWPVRLPGSDGKDNSYWTTAHVAADIAIREWVQVAANQTEKAYEVSRAKVSADSGDVARSFRDHVARCSGMKSPG